jgi:hypothetical protein
MIMPPLCLPDSALVCTIARSQLGLSKEVTAWCEPSKRCKNSTSQPTTATLNHMFMIAHVRESDRQENRRAVGDDRVSTLHLSDDVSSTSAYSAWRLWTLYDCQMTGWDR